MEPKSDKAMLVKAQQHWHKRIVKYFKALAEIENDLMALADETGSRKLARIVARYNKLRSRMADTVTAKLLRNGAEEETRHDTKRTRRQSARRA